MYDGNTVILELDGNGAEKARNVYGRDLIARESDGEKAIYRYNGHGDVIALNAPNGDMIAEYAYDEFGQVIEEQAAPQATPMVDIDFSVEGSEEYDFPEDSIFDNPYRYAGYEYLDEVELYDLNARYYDPSIARFLTEDPYYNLGNRVMGVYEINVPNVYSIMQANALYAYCGNSPVMFDDRAGLDLVSIRDYTNQYEGIVVWDDTNDMAYFTIIYEVMLKMGVPLDVPVQYIEVNGKIVYIVGAFLIMIALFKNITAEDIESIAAYAPAKIICAESSFKDDSALSNAHYILRDKQIELKLV